MLIEEELMNKIKKELNEAADTLLEIHTVLLVMSYTLGTLTDEVDSGLSGRFAEDIDGKRSINHADIIFGIRTTLKRSADIAHERAHCIANFKGFLSDLKNR
jgi:hypothetical protein